MRTDVDDDFEEFDTDAWYERQTAAEPSTKLTRGQYLIVCLVCAAVPTISLVWAIVAL